MKEKSCITNSFRIICNSAKILPFLCITFSSVLWKPHHLVCTVCLSRHDYFIKKIYSLHTPSFRCTRENPLILEDWCVQGAACREVHMENTSPVHSIFRPSSAFAPIWTELRANSCWGGSGSQKEKNKRPGNQIVIYTQI